jgi:hypothetical protein
MRRARFATCLRGSAPMGSCESEECGLDVAREFNARRYDDGELFERIDCSIRRSAGGLPPLRGAARTDILAHRRAATIEQRRTPSSDPAPLVRLREPRRHRRGECRAPSALPKRRRHCPHARHHAHTLVPSYGTVLAGGRALWTEQVAHFSFIRTARLPPPGVKPGRSGSAILGRPFVVEP